MSRTDSSQTQRTTRNSQRAGILPGLSAIRRSTLSSPRPSSTFGTTDRSTNIFRQIGSGAPSISANLMSSNRSPQTPRPPTPLEYADTSRPDNSGELPEAGEPSGPDGPGGPDGPDGDPDPEDPDDEPPTGQNPEVNPEPNDRFLDALFELSDSLRTLRQNQSPPREEKIKVRDPDTFDGSNPRRLRDFLVSCNLHFRDRPQVFASDEKKILFILSYLKGSALSWFEPGLNDPTDSAHWMWDYQVFLGELEGNFGPHDPVGDAEKALAELSMKKTGHITKYNVDFWELASRVDWNEAALRDRYYRGLPLRLRTELLRGGRPETLASLRLKAQDADNIYWMQEEEIRLETRSSGNSGNSGRREAKGISQPNVSGQPRPHSSFPANRRNFGNSSGARSMFQRDKPRETLSDKIGKNGKLTGEEKDRRMKEGLCLYCGEKGHIAGACPKSRSTKGRSAVIESRSDSADSKK
jgi:Domain of unknown function (DUF4939)